MIWYARDTPQDVYDKFLKNETKEEAFKLLEKLALKRPELLENVKKNVNEKHPEMVKGFLKYQADQVSREVRKVNQVDEVDKQDDEVDNQLGNKGQKNQRQNAKNRRQSATM